MPQSDPHGEQPVMMRGASIADARTAIILLHGRGGAAEDIIDLGEKLGDARTALIAPQAAQHTWYPNSFLAPLAQNEPWLSSAIAKVGACVGQCLEAGLGRERVAIAGFSQGACLATEFVARNPSRYGALIAFTGGLIGPQGMILKHPGSLEGTPVLLSSGDPDPHIPWQRVEETAAALREMDAAVRAVRYANRPHAVLPEEIQMAAQLLSTQVFV
jgi:predicted esterase